MSENKYEKYLGLSKYQDNLLLQTEKSTFLQLLFFCGVLTIIFASISLFSIIVLCILKAIAIIFPILKLYTTFYIAYILLIAAEVFMFHCTEHIIYVPNEYIIDVNGEIFDISAIKVTPILKLWRSGSIPQYRVLSDKDLGDNIGIITFYSGNKEFNVFGSYLSYGHNFYFLEEE